MFVSRVRKKNYSTDFSAEKLFRFLPVTYQIDIRTAKFLQKFLTNDDSICRLFSQTGRNKFKEKFFSGYGDVKSVHEMRIAAENMYFGCQ